MPKASTIPCIQGRYWMIVIPFAKWSIPQTWSDDIQYICGQQEIGEGGYHHWQIMCAFKTKKRLKAAKSYFCNEANLRLTKSEAADAYCWKEETRVEGTQFEHGKRAFQRNKKSDWDLIKADAQSGNFDNIPADIYMRYYGNITRIAKDHARPEFRHGIECHVYWGSTGTGKSHRAFQEAPGAYIKNPNIKWWDGYQGESNVIVDEFSGLIDITYLLRWIDHYPCMVEVKGGAICLKCIKFIFTSNLHPDDWYPNAKPAHKQALLRRITSIILMDTPYVPPAPTLPTGPTLSDQLNRDWDTHSLDSNINFYCN